MAIAKDRWFRAGIETELPIWGFRDGIRVGIWPAGFEGGDGGPRGLLRIGYPIVDGGKTYGLINFIAVEPIVAGRRGFSELEKSAADGKPGKRMWVGKDPDERPLTPGEIGTEHGRESLRLSVHVERFENGAEVTVDLQFRSDRPDEVRLAARAEAGSAAIQRCVLTATMGNYARVRRIQLRDGYVTPDLLWPGFSGNGFAPDALIPVDRLPVTRDGDLMICATTDESDPHAVPPDPRAPGWAYRGTFPVTQYWRMERGSWSRNLHLRLNARRVYWASEIPIPGGPAFENIDLVQDFTSTGPVILGISRKPPRGLGIRASARPLPQYP